MYLLIKMYVNYIRVHESENSWLKEQKSWEKHVRSMTRMSNFLQDPDVDRRRRTKMASASNRLLRVKSVLFHWLNDVNVLTRCFDIVARFKVGESFVSFLYCSSDTCCYRKKRCFVRRPCPLQLTCLLVIWIHCLFDGPRTIVLFSYNTISELMDPRDRAITVF